VYAPRKEGFARWVEEECALDEVQRIDDEEVVLAVAAADDQPVEGCEQALRNVPFEALLEFEEFAEGRVAREIGEHLARRLFSVPAMVGGMLPRTAWAQEANLREKTLDLF
jgi:hypothetical protein